MRLAISLLMMTLILAACGGDAAPTSAVSSDPTIDPNSVTATPNDFVEQQLATEEVDEGDGEDESVVIVTPQAVVEGNDVPLPGTLVHDSEYVDENMGAVFDQIIFSRYGGGDNAPPYRLVVNQDGTYDINGEIFGQVDPSTVTQVDDILDEINFFGINTPMLGPGPDAINYRYVLTVYRGDDEMSIRAEDGYTPQPVMRLFGALMGIIVNSANTSNTAEQPQEEATPSS
jgi:hypothetical protein